MSRTLWTLICVAVAAIVIEGMLITITGGGSNNATTPTRHGSR